MRRSQGNAAATRIPGQTSLTSVQEVATGLFAAVIQPDFQALRVQLDVHLEKLVHLIP